MSLTAYEAKCIRIALAFGDPAIEGIPHEDLESAKVKLLAIEKGEHEPFCMHCKVPRSHYMPGRQGALVCVCNPTEGGHRWVVDA